MLLLIILPFFTSLIVRTVAWQTHPERRRLGRARVPDARPARRGRPRLLATRTAVIAGITYNFLPFMALPLYASLERLDRRLIEAATDLYASRWTAFRKVTAPARRAGHLRRHAAHVHPGDRRLHQRAAAGHLAELHDRQRHPVAVPHRARLPDRGALSLRPDGRRPACVIGIAARGLGLRGDSSEAAAAHRRPTVVAASATGRHRGLGDPRDRLPVHPDLRDRPVLVQRQQGPLQLHLAGLHAQALGRTRSAIEDLRRPFTNVALDRRPDDDRSP